MKSLKLTFGILIICIIFSGCAKPIDIKECLTDDIYGFWGGLWHGIIAPFSFVVSLFNEDVAMYAKNNNGNWYNFGFVLGAGILFGSGGKSTK